MKLGDKEWFKKLEEHYQFPMYVAFYIASDGSVNTKGIETKASVSSTIQYQKVRPPKLINGIELALVSVVYCKTSQDYYNESIRIRSVWKLKK